MKDKSYTSRKDQAVLTKKKIFDITALLIKKKGYNKITIREICQNAEISVGTFYLYFLSKDDILLDIYHKLLLNLPEEAAKLSSLSPIEQILQTTSYFLEQLHNSFDKNLIREIYRINLSANSDPLLCESSTFFQLLVHFLEKASADRKLLPPYTPTDTVSKIIIFIHGCLVHWLMDESDDFNKMKEECLMELKHYLSLYLA